MDKSSKNLVAVARGVLADAAAVVKDQRTFNALRAAYQQSGIENGGFEYWNEKDRRWRPMEGGTVRTLEDVKQEIKKHGILVRQVFHAQVMLEPDERRLPRPKWID